MKTDEMNTNDGSDDRVKVESATFFSVTSPDFRILSMHKLKHNRNVRIPDCDNDETLIIVVTKSAWCALRSYSCYVLDNPFPIRHAHFMSLIFCII